MACLPVMRSALNSIQVEVWNTLLDKFTEGNEVTEEDRRMRSGVPKLLKED
ncbi:hypothetical protein I79_018739 [Cricetulus griseus]|uniref:Uncharacterized protein n=1 Tax=Cricetulus griseus TaxID=10029 RepID=G3I5J0_CRIGR|nr:hypothetical protein I79_018739 [Cricetulus griseus]